MPRLPLPKLKRTLDSAPPAPAYYLHGSEAVLKDGALSLILERVLEPGTRDFNLDIVSAQQIDPGELAAACSTLPMMAERRVVVLRDVETWKRKSKGKQPAMQYLERPAPETVLVMVQGNDDDPDTDLASRAVSIDCAPLSGDQLDAWLDRGLARREVTLTPDAREHLIRATGSDLGLLTAEIEKLSGLPAGVAIDVDMVSAMVGVRSGETVEDWRDAVLRDDTARALGLIPGLLDQTGVTGVGMVTLLGTSLLVVRWARVSARRNEALRDARLARAIVSDLLLTTRIRVGGSYGPFAAMISDVVEQWPLSRLRSALALTLKADMSLKNTAISGEEGILTDLVLALGVQRQRLAA